MSLQNSVQLKVLPPVQVWHSSQYVCPAIKVLDKFWVTLKRIYTVLTYSTPYWFPQQLEAVMTCFLEMMVPEHVWRHVLMLLNYHITWDISNFIASSTYLVFAWCCQCPMDTIQEKSPTGTAELPFGFWRQAPAKGWFNMPNLNSLMI